MALYKIGVTEAGDAGVDLSWEEKLGDVDAAVLITKCVSPDFFDATLRHKDMSIAHKSSVFPLRLKRLLSTAKKTHWWSRRIAESVRTTKTSSQATSCSASITKNMCRSIRGGGFMTSTPMKGFLGLP